VNKDTSISHALLKTTQNNIEVSHDGLIKKASH